METMGDLWGELGASVRRFVGRRVNDPHAADDVTQDVLLKVQSQLGTLPPEDRLPAWVFATARNAVVDYYRARAVRERVAPGGGVEVAADVTDDERQSAVAELAPCVAKMVDRLPSPYRDAMRLADLDGLPQQQVAQRLGVSLSGAKSRVQRARRQLREMILDCCNIERDRHGNVLDVERTERSGRYCAGEEGCDR